MKRPVRTVLAVPLLVCLAISGCAATTQKAALVDPRFAQAPDTPLNGQALLLPVYVSAAEVDVQENVRRDEERGREFAAAVRDELVRLPVPANGLEIRDLPELDAEEAAFVEQHVRLFHLVAETIMTAHYGEDPIRRTVIADLDYSVGDGLSFLRDRSGVDRALVVVGTKTTPSGGRVATSVVAAVALSLAVPGMVFIPTPEPVMAYLVAGIVDLESGELLWLYPGAGTNFSNETSIRETLSVMLGLPVPDRPDIGEV